MVHDAAVALGRDFPVDEQFEAAILPIGNDVATAARSDKMAVQDFPAAGQGLHLVATPAVGVFAIKEEFEAGSLLRVGEGIDRAILCPQETCTKKQSQE